MRCCQSGPRRNYTGPFCKLATQAPSVNHNFIQGQLDPSSASGVAGCQEIAKVDMEIGAMKLDGQPRIDADTGMTILRSFCRPSRTQPRLDCEKELALLRVEFDQESKRCASGGVRNREQQAPASARPLLRSAK